MFSTHHLTAPASRCLTPRMSKAEEDAIEHTLRGDRDSYRTLVDLHYPVVFRLAFRITGSAEDAEEVAQEAFLRAYTKLADFRQTAAFSTWIHRIAVNTALNLVERRSRDLNRLAEPIVTTGEAEPADHHHATPERALLDREAAALRLAAMAALTPMERTAFTLRHMEDLPIPEIAAALHVPANSAKQAVFRAVTKLRRSLAPLAGGLR